MPFGMRFMWGEWRWLLPPTVLAVWAGLAEHPLLFTLALLLLGVLVLLFSEKPPQVPTLPLGILSPASGRVIAVEEVQDSRLPRSSILVTIQVGLFSAYHCYSPTEGLIKECWYRPAEGAASGNDYRSYWVRTDEGDDLVVAQSCRRFLGASRFHLQPGQRLGHGHQFGALRFGGIITCSLPNNAELVVSVGQVVRAGQDLLGHFVHPQGPRPANGAIS